MMKDGLSTDDRKAVFLVALKELDGNLTKACEASSVSRQCYYNWMDKDEEFATAVKMTQLKVTEEMLDEAEEVIKFAVKRGDREVAKWVLGRLGKQRGYGSKVEVNTPLARDSRDWSSRTSPRVCRIGKSRAPGGSCVIASPPEG